MSNQNTGPTNEDRIKHFRYLHELRIQIEAIEVVLDTGLGFDETLLHIDFLSLQFRKCFEGILMHSLCTNPAKCEQINKNFGKVWRIKDLIRILRELNPKFYPTPIMKIDPTKGFVMPSPAKLQQLKAGNLTLEELESFHGICSDILHASNPYKKTNPYNKDWTVLNIWLDKTKNLLSSFRVDVAETSYSWEVDMNFGTTSPPECREYFNF